MTGAPAAAPGPAGSDPSAPPASGKVAAPATKTPDATPQPDAAVVRVVAGSPSAEELAALVTVLAALETGGDPDQDDARPASGWAAPAARLRTAYGPRPGGWRDSALPR